MRTRASILALVPIATVVLSVPSLAAQFFVAAPGTAHDVVRNDIVELCSVLNSDSVFTCREKWQTGAAGTAYDGVDDLQTALKITSDSLGPNRLKGVRWLVLDDRDLASRTIGRQALDIPKPFLGFFSFQEDITLFQLEDSGDADSAMSADSEASEMQGTTSMRRRLSTSTASSFAGTAAFMPPRSRDAMRGRRGLLADDDTTRNSLIVQHAATPALGAMSTFAGGCTSQCRSDANYYYSSDGRDVQVYIVDGTVMDHAQFKDIRTGSTRLDVDRFLSESARASDPDCAGDHATHVAGIASGFEFGSSKAAKIVSVAVQPGCEASGMASDLIEGLEWVLERQRAFGSDRPPAVVSMSLILQDGSDVADLVKDTIQELIGEGVSVVVAAGNFHEDACDFVPANIADAITVAGASVFPGGSRAIAWSWSNYGPCVDVFAPAVDIESANPECYECTAKYSGTSQATPFVTGLVAQYLAVNPRASPAEVKRELLAGATDQFLEVFTYPYDSTSRRFAQSLVDLRVQQVRFSDA